MTPTASSQSAAVFPAKGRPVTEADISFARRKPRWVTFSLAYRLLRLLTPVIGARHLLRFSLNATWIFWRFSYELSAGLYGGAFRNTTYGTSADLLERWIPPGGSVVDIGCGGGRLCQLAAPYAGRVVGIDYDPRLIARATRENVWANVEYRVGDVTTAFPIERFDLAVLVAVLEHIEDVDVLLQAIGRVAPRLLVEVPDFEADCLNLVRREVGCPWYTDDDHVREYTEPVLRAHLERNGWHPVQWDRRGGMMLALAERRPA